MNQGKDSWCSVDIHSDFELFEDFNSWIDQGEEIPDSPLLSKLNLVGLSHPSKAFFAGDKEAYEQALQAYRIARRHEVLSREYFLETYGEEDGIHWFERNEQRFNQLVERALEEMVVPFIGAGISVGGGFPTWTNHLRQQARTAGISPSDVDAWLSTGRHEEHIENTYGKEVFAQEIRDVFSRTGAIQDITLRIADLFKDTLITTNYDKLLEQVFDTGSEPYVQVINGMAAMDPPAADKITIIKVHGDITQPDRCILGKAQYDQAYGEEQLDLERPIPKLLGYYFKNNSLVFIGCSLRNDRTIRVFRSIKEESGDFFFPQHFSIEQAPETAEDLRTRNAELARLGITAIWFPHGEFQLVEEILRQARNELNYSRAQITSL